MFPHFDKSANSQPFQILNHFPSKARLFSQLFRSTIPNFPIFSLQNIWTISLVVFLTEPYCADSHPLFINLTIFQPIPVWEWPKLNSQLFPKFAASVRDLFEMFQQQLTVLHYPILRMPPTHPDKTVQGDSFEMYADGGIESWTCGQYYFFSLVRQTN